MNTYNIQFAPGTNVTAWWGFCASCATYFGQHKWNCPNMPTFATSANCRCPNCRPDIHSTCADVLKCEPHRQ